MTRYDQPPTTGALAALGRTAGGVAHDFDNALTAIVTHASLLRSEAHDPAAIALRAEAILRAARAASQVVERVRTLLRPRGGRDPSGSVTSVRVAVDAVLDQASELMAARARERGVEVAIARRAGLVEVAGDPAELLQAIVNLGHNAIDASPRGAVVALAAEAGEREVIVTVTDTGQGIAPALRERVFEPFFTTKGEAGTGLGLALCKAIIEGHGGRLTLSPGASTGTVATIALPLAHAGVPAPRQPTDVELRGVGGDARVLLVDDDDVTRDALGALFDASGFQVTACATMEEALGAYARERPDLVVTDLQLGAGGSGAVLIAQLGALDASVPIIVASGAADVATWTRRVAAVLPKPISPGTLLATARELVARRRAWLRNPTLGPSGSRKG